MARVAPERPTHTRRAAFHLLRARGGMASLRAAVTLLDVRDPGLRELAEGTVREWNWQGSLQAGWADPAELGALLERSAHLFDIHQLTPLFDRLALTETDRPDHTSRPTR